MPAIVTDQFRILNASNFVDSVVDTNNSYYVFLGLPDPTETAGSQERTTSWNTATPSPIDSINYSNFVGDGMIFGKRVNVDSVRRVVRKIDWVGGTKYEMYRHDYSVGNLSPITKTPRLYNSNYYVINSEYKVYICIDNGSSGISTTGNASLDEPTFIDLEPSAAGSSGDGYLWKYLFTVSPSDIVKFDSTEYITLPNNWYTSSNAQIQAVRENGNSDENENQIKKVYIQNPGASYKTANGVELDILGDGTGGKVIVTIAGGKVTEAIVSAGGKGYTYGRVDLSSYQPSTITTPAHLIPIIPPSKGHGYDLYKELGADRVLVYSRFDDSVKDFPSDTVFSQIGIVKNPTSYSSTNTFTANQFSSLYALKLTDNFNGVPVVGDRITQTVPGGGIARGIVASYDENTKVLKYFQDRSLHFNQTNRNQSDDSDVKTRGKVYAFSSLGGSIGGDFTASINTTFNGSQVTLDNVIVNLDVNFTNGVANPEINKKSGEIIYIDNRPAITRSTRQKEDVKIILEF
jgi:hypothetical protein